MSPNASAAWGSATGDHRASGRQRGERPRRLPLIYTLASRKLRAFDRVALDVAAGLADEFAPMILAPEGETLAEARRYGFHAEAVGSRRALRQQLVGHLERHENVVVLTSTTQQSLVVQAVSLMHDREVVHLHVADERLAECDVADRQLLLNRVDCHFVAKSLVTRDVLMRHKVDDKRVTVIDRFLPNAFLSGVLGRPRFSSVGIRRVLVACNEPSFEAMNLLIATLDVDPAIAKMDFRVVGAGDVAKDYEDSPSVSFLPAVGDLSHELLSADLLLQLGGPYSTDLAVLQAMAAKVPVLISARSADAGVVDDGLTGFHFHRWGPAELAARLSSISKLAADDLNRLADRAAFVVTQCYSSRQAVEHYRQAIHDRLARIRLG